MLRSGLAFLQLKDKKKYNMLHEKLKPWPTKQIPCLSEELHRTLNDGYIFAVTSTEKNPRGLEYAEISHDISPITIEDDILTVNGSSPDDNTIPYDHNYNDGSPVVHCNESGSSCILLGFVLTKNHFSKIYKPESPPCTKILLLYNPQKSLSTGNGGKFLKKTADVTGKSMIAVSSGVTQATASTGMIAGGIVGAVIATPIFVGGKIAKTFFHSHSNTPYIVGGATLAGSVVVGSAIGGIAGKIVTAPINLAGKALSQKRGVLSQHSKVSSTR